MKQILKEAVISWSFLALLVYVASLQGWPASWRSPEWIMSHGAMRYDIDYNLDLHIRLEDGTTVKLTQEEIKKIAARQKEGE